MSSYLLYGKCRFFIPFNFSLLSFGGDVEISFAFVLFTFEINCFSTFFSSKSQFGKRVNLTMWTLPFFVMTNNPSLVPHSGVRSYNGFLQRVVAVAPFPPARIQWNFFNSFLHWHLIHIWIYWNTTKCLYLYVFHISWQYFTFECDVCCYVPLVHRKNSFCPGKFLEFFLNSFCQLIGNYLKRLRSIFPNKFRIFLVNRWEILRNRYKQRNFDYFFFQFRA